MLIALGGQEAPEERVWYVVQSCRLPHFQNVFLYVMAFYHIILFQLDKQG